MTPLGRTKSLASAEDLAAFGRSVIEHEAQALLRLADRLDGSFSESVRILEEALARGGRVLLTGLGKSGLAARKIASTLCSTGAPAIFIHASEAAHGDLGLITPGDALIAISRSGEFENLGSVLTTAERLKVPIIAWTAAPSSPLAREADLTILLDVGPEADPDGVIPTASSTATIALGDAVAIALYRGRGLKAEDFAQLHPGGALGRRLTLRVRDLMRVGEDLPLVGVNEGLLDVLHVISDKRLGIAIITGDDGVMCGVLTDGDVRRALVGNPDGLTQPVHEFMTGDPKTIAADELVVRAIQRMEEPARRITALVVADEAGRPVGVIHLHDCLDAGLR